MHPLFYTSLSSRFGKISILWQEAPKGSKVQYIALPSEQKPSEYFKAIPFVPVNDLSSPAIRALATGIENYLKGEAVDFALNIFALEQCPAFQRKVLLAEYNIPRGYVSTYGRIAKKLRVPGGARAVGNALANNPFPIVIPCHRAVRSNGEIGGYRGGLKMKRSLLEMEGIKFTKTGKVIMDKVTY